MRIAIMGTGGVGGYFGGRLAAAGCDVHFIARGAHRQALASEGLRIRSPLGDLHLPSVQVTDDPASVGPVDLVLFGVKLWDTRAAAEAIRPLVGPGTAVLSLQNGVDKDDVLADVLGPGAVLGGVCYIESTIESPGLVVHGNRMQKIVVGEYDGSSTPRVERFASACRAAGIELVVSPDIARTIWEKFIFLVGLSATTSTVRAPIGVVRANPESRELLAAVMREAAEVARAGGVAIAPDFVEGRLAFCDELAPTMTSSMHRDLERGQRLEVRWLSGEVSRRGAALDVATPVNTTILRILAPHADGALR